MRVAIVHCRGRVVMPVLNSDFSRSRGALRCEMWRFRCFRHMYKVPARISRDSLRSPADHDERQRGLMRRIAQRVVGPRTRAPEGGDHWGVPEIASKVPSVPNLDGLRRMRGPPRGDSVMPEVVPCLGKLRDGRWPFVFGHSEARGSATLRGGLPQLAPGRSRIIVLRHCSADRGRRMRFESCSADCRQSTSMYCKHTCFVSSILCPTPELAT